MKATINGVSVEGTPQEIAEYRRLVGVHIPVYINTPDVHTVKDDGKDPFRYVWESGHGPTATF